MTSRRKKWTPKSTREPKGLVGLRAFLDTRLAEDDPFSSPTTFKVWLLRNRLVDETAAVTAEDSENARAVRAGLVALLAHSSGAEPDEDAVRRLNAALHEVPYCVRLGLASGRREPVAQGWPLVRARLAEDVLAAMQENQWRRLKLCPDCGKTFFDTSSNGSRKWCSTTCSSRTTSRSFRRRHPSPWARNVAGGPLRGGEGVPPPEES